MISQNDLPNVILTLFCCCFSGDINQKLKRIIFEIEDIERTVVKIRVKSSSVDDVKRAQEEAEVVLLLFFVI